MNHTRNASNVVDPTEVRVPAALLAAGMVILLLYGFIQGGLEGASSILILAAMELLIGVPLAILACFIAAALLGGEFGVFHTAILKLASAFIFPMAVALLIPFGFLAGLVAIVLYWGMLEKFFDLDVTELMICIVLIFLVRLAAGVAAAMILA